MKSIKIAVCGFLCAMLAGSVIATGFVRDNFDTDSGSLDGVRTWKTTGPSVVVTNEAYHGAGGQAVKIPIMQSVSNVPVIDAGEKLIWTDFYTIPRPFVSSLDGAPTVDLNASAQFFVTSNGEWKIIHKEGGMISTTAVSAVNSVTNDGVTWQHVSVLHNYSSNTWSLLINDRILAANKGFIGSPSSYSWFTVENGGGNSTNVTWLDDVQITNRVPDTLVADLDQDFMIDAWELMYLGGTNVSSGAGDFDADGVSDAQEAYFGMNGGSSNEAPTPAQIEETAFNATNAGIVSVENPALNDLVVTFRVGSNRVYKVLGCSSYGNPYVEINGAVISNAPSSGVTNWVHNNVLASAANYYYKLVAQTENGVFVDTNDVTYAVHVKSLATQPGVSNFFIGLTVNYGTNNTMNSVFGDQLKKQLGPEDQLTVWYNGKANVFWIEDGAWVAHPNNEIDADGSIPLGVGMVVTRLNSGSARVVFTGEMITNRTLSLPLQTNWNMIAWPFEGSNLINDVKSGLKTASSENDYMWIYRNGAYKQVRKLSGGDWRMSGGAPLPENVRYLQLGESVFYKNSVGDAFNWTPTNSVP